MTETAQKPKPTSAVPTDFLTSEELRSVLHRFHAQGGDTWRQDPVAAELMEYIRGKHAGLAVKHGLDPWEAVSAARPHPSGPGRHRPPPHRRTRPRPRAPARRSTTPYGF